MSSSFEPTKKTWVEQFTLKQNPTICRQASACKSWDFFLYHLKMLQRIHNGILFFLQTLGLFDIFGFWLIVSLPLFFVNNKAADSLPLEESTSGFIIFQFSRTQKSAPAVQRVPCLLPYSAL